MRTYTLTLCYTLIFVLDFYIITAQLPPRINIPGALLLPQSKPIRQRVHNDLGPPPRLRRPIPNAAPAPIRPVVEEPEDNPQTNPPQIDNFNNNNNNFDDEVSKLGISALQSAVRQANEDNEPPSPPTPILPPKPVQFRPERPVPLLRQDIRDTPPPPPPRPLPVQRQEQARQIQRQDENVRRVSPSRQSPSSPQQFRQVTRINPAPVAAPPRQSSQFIDLNYERETTRRRKPTVQILRKYRTDNPDGSITWGYENEDGSFKEETLGVDCVTRGKYGYIDPDGVRREYNYETGNKCDQREEQEVEQQQQQQNKQPIIQSQNRKAQPQFRQLPPSQY